ncbi:MAG: hypothetical protein KJ990_10735 [Proteobacteria bacterium]|nr:hypothetical protein [Pseudomonadota bacterium]MBU1650512.1 hypothetical protein [Pseudomonadota bacterium]
MQKDDSTMKKLKLSFKGERTYIQGTNLYTAVTEAVKDIFVQDRPWINYIAFRQFAQSGCTIVLGSDSLVSFPIVGHFACQTGEGKIKGQIYETFEMIEKRLPFNEEQMNNTAVIEEKSIIQFRRAGFLAIEEIVFLTKHLHNSLLPPKQGQWVFTQIDLIAPFSNDDNVLYAIHLKQNIANRITISEIEENGHILGKINFSIGKL